MNIRSVAGEAGGTGTVDASAGSLTTHGNDSSALFAQSIGGGGNGGFSISGAAGDALAGSLAVGGKGGSGGFASAVPD